MMLAPRGGKMTCKLCEEWRKESEYWKRENQRNQEVARELSLELDSLREKLEGGTVNRWLLKDLRRRLKDARDTT